MSEYPSRPPYFAYRVIRLMTKVCAANQISADGCWLVTIVAMLEDVKKYSAPIGFWNEQLMPLCGFGSRKRLVTARAKAVEHGWLVYQPGGKSRSGIYWAAIPPEYADIADTACDEQPAICRSDTERKAERKAERNRICRSESGRNAERQRGAMRNGKGAPSTTTSSSASSSSSEPGLTAGSEQPDAADAFPTVGQSKHWHAPAKLLADLAVAFPGVDVPGEVRKAKLWCEANATKRKTPRGMPKFLVGWMERAQNRGGSNGNGKAQAGEVRCQVPDDEDLKNWRP
ncbi:MAG: hypothetical protein ACOY3P_07350 [Planctomycetota bacterium]